MTRLIAILIAGSIAGAGAAYADEVTGAIKAVNPQARTVTLDNDKTYSFIGSVNLTQVKVGDKVKVTYTPATTVFVSMGIHGSGTKIAAAN